MRVLMVHDYAGYFGGVEQQIADMARGLRDRGHTLALGYQTETDRRSREFLGLFDVSYVIDPASFSASARTEGPDVSEKTTITRAISDFRPDTLVIHKAPSVRFMEDGLSGIRSVRMVHDHELVCPRRYKYFLFSEKVCHKPVGIACWLDFGFVRKSETGAKSWEYRSIPKMKREMKRNYSIDALVVPSRFMADEFELNGFEANRIAVVWPARYPETAAASTETAAARTSFLRGYTPGERDLYPKEKRVAYVGRLARAKGVDLLLRALAELRERPDFDDLSLDIVGVGPAEDSLRRLAVELGVDRIVHYHDWLPAAEFGRLLEESKIVAIPSRWPEPFGLVGLEAMRLGRAVVAYDVGGIRDWVIDGETGTLVPEQDVGAFADACADLLQNSDKAAEFGRRGRARAESDFGFDRYITQIERIFSGAESSTADAQAR